MRLNFFEKSEKLGPTIFMNEQNICFASGISQFLRIHFSKNLKLKFKDKKLYLSYLYILYNIIYISY